MSDHATDNAPTSNSDVDSTSTVPGIATVARTQDTLIITVPLFTSGETIAGILAALGSGAKLIDHASDLRRSTDLILTFRLSSTPPARSDTPMDVVPPVNREPEI
jgi:hypothetical protein